jgi:hypothetical protein
MGRWFDQGSASGSAMRSLLPVLLLLAIAPRLACAQEAATEPNAPERTSYEIQSRHGPAYPVGRIELEYLRENPLHPSLDEVLPLTFTLGTQPSGYTRPEPGEPTVTMSFARIWWRPVETYHASAIQHMLETLRDWLNERDLIGVYVTPDPTQLAAGRDLRPPGDTTLTFLVSTAMVTQMRTLAAGERVGENAEIKPDARIDNPVHDRIRDRSPIQPYFEGEPTRRDLLRKSVLDEYLYWLGRHPGRLVRGSLSAAEDGGALLDYEVIENRPLIFYAQLNNTGTESTDRLRQRIGLQHTQLTNADDILSIDFSTAAFDEYNRLFAAYERPFENDRIRWRVYGGWYEYTARELGFFSDLFKGEQYSLGGEVIANVYQKDELFIDVLGGARFDAISVDNDAFGIEGSDDFIVPYIGARLDRTTGWAATRGLVTLEGTTGSWTDVDEGGLTRLGRFDPSEDWLILRWNLMQSTYLEPLFDREAWEDPSTPGSSQLVHEVFASFKGQYAFDNRLIPQYQQVVGGLYTVRGYPESVVAGDTALIGTLEYRLHVPRAFKLEAEPRELFGDPFRVARRSSPARRWSEPASVSTSSSSEVSRFASTGASPSTAYPAAM